MRRIRFLVDVDEVLADFQTPAFEAIYQVTGKRYKQEDFLVWDVFSELSPEELKAIDAVIETPGFCFSLKPRQGACEAIEKIRDFADIYAVTSPTHTRHWVYERVEWLKKFFAFNKKEVLHAHAKFLVGGDAFLDDKPDHVQEWGNEHPGKLAMLWHHTNTRTLGAGLLRVYTWDDVVRRVRQIAEES